MVKITKAQSVALVRKYRQNSDGSKSFLEFRRKVLPAFGMNCIMIKWCGMCLGIESDGYTHS